MTGKETLNLIQWLKKRNYSGDEIIECIQFVLSHELEESETTKDKEE